MLGVYGYDSDTVKKYPTPLFFRRLKYIQHCFPKLSPRDSFKSVQDPHTINTYLI